MNRERSGEIQEALQLGPDRSPVDREERGLHREQRQHDPHAAEPGRVGQDHGNRLPVFNRHVHVVRIGQSNLHLSASDEISVSPGDLREQARGFQPGELLVELAGVVDLRVDFRHDIRGIDRLHDVGAALIAVSTPVSENLGQETVKSALEAFKAGRFEAQDEGSQLLAELVAPPPRGLVVDLCAGAGGKTLALAAEMAANAPLAVQAAKRLMRMGLGESFDDYRPARLVPSVATIPD